MLWKRVRLHEISKILPHRKCGSGDTFYKLTFHKKN